MFGVIMVDGISTQEAQDWVDGLDKEIAETRRKLVRMQNRRDELDRQIREFSDLELDTLNEWNR